MIKLPPILENSLRVFAALNAVALCGLGSIVIRRWSVAASWALLVELLLCLIAVGAAYAEERHLARMQHERELVKLGKKKGVEF